MSDRGLVLVAEDSIVVRRFARAQLEGAGYAVLDTPDGHDALATIQSERPDVILLDLQMPGLDTDGLLGALRDDGELAAVPVVVMSGRVDPGDVDAGLGAGAHDVLRKPFEPLDLLARVGAAMRTRRLQHELRALGAELERQATTDSLTGLANRRFLDGQLDRLSARSARHGRELAVLLLDIDGFRSLNDAHGHEAGDAALAQIGRRLLNRCRREDIVGRWGGEEFLVVAPDIGAQGAWVLAEALRTAVSGEPLVVAGRTVAVTASIGWSTWRADGDSAGALVHRADRALYAAKSAGRDAVRGETA